MIRFLVFALWICLTIIGSAYFATNFQASAEPPAPPKKVEVVSEGTQFRNIPAVTIPMIQGGAIQGYVAVKLVFATDGQAMKDLPGDIQPFLLDETFRHFYDDGKIDFRNISKYNFDEMLANIKKSINSRLGIDLVKDVLIIEVNYVETNNRH